MRILQIVDTYPPSEGYGVARHVEGLSRALIGNGHDIHVVTQSRSKGELEARHGVRVHGVTGQYPFFAYNDILEAVLHNLPLSEEIVRVCEEHGPFDLVIAHEWNSGVASSLAKRVFNVPLVAVLHGCQVGRMGGQGCREQLFVADMEKWLCERADSVVVESAYVRAELEKNYQIPRGKIALVPGGVDPKAFSAQVDRAEFRSMFAEPEEAIVLFAGRFLPEKGPDLFIEIANIVSQKRPNTRFVLSGDGSMREMLAKRAENLGLSNRIRFTGCLGPVVLGALYQVSDIMVIPSRYESAGVSAIEAAMHRLPVVASNVGGIPELARDLGSERVRLISGGEAGRFSQSVTEMLSDGQPAGDGRLSDETLVPLKFRWASVARGMEKVFESLVAGVAR